MTIAWPMVAATCLTLGLIELRVGLARPPDAARLLFSLSAFAVAALCGIELAMMRANTPAEFQDLLRALDVAAGVTIASLTAFIWVYFRSGNKWLALAGPCLYGAALVFDFIPGSSLGYLELTGLRTVETFGGASYRVLEGVPNPWNILTYLGVLMMLVFVVDASVRLWRRGGRRRAAIVGAGVAFWAVAAGAHSALIEIGVLQMPYLVSFAYLGILLAMSYELSTDVSAAAQFARQLQESERRMDLASAAAGLGMWTWDLARDEIWATSRARTLFGFSDSERINRARFNDAVHPEDRDLVRIAIDTSLSRLRALLKRRSIEPCALAVSDLLRNVAVLTRADAAVRHIALELEAPADLPAVMGDGVHLQQVLLNLVLNAMDAVDAAPGRPRRVAVRARNHGGRNVEVAVSDTGHGIPPDKMALVFEPFFTTKANGMGIGLSISRTIIEAHGGRIWAESAVGDGATFRFTLPTAEERATA
jgi:signal transduction histidine kinase